jgi:hypothetical protein
VHRLLLAVALSSCSGPQCQEARCFRSVTLLDAAWLEDGARLTLTTRWALSGRVEVWIDNAPKTPFAVRATVDGRALRLVTTTTPFDIPTTTIAVFQLDRDHTEGAAVEIASTGIASRVAASVHGSEPYDCVHCAR